MKREMNFPFFPWRRFIGAPEAYAASSFINTVKKSPLSLSGNRKQEDYHNILFVTLNNIG
jgi:hypothetical protein